MIIDKDLLSMQHARILAENACLAQKKLSTFSQEYLDAIVERVADAVEPHLEALAHLSQEETDYGRWQDKLVKNRFVCGPLRNSLRNVRCVGVIREDSEQQIQDIGVPIGVLVGVCPATSPVSTTIYKSLLAVKSGNAIIFSPHPRAVSSMARVLDIMISAAESAGLPAGSLSYLTPVTKSGTLELMKHPAISLVLMTGVPGLYETARLSGKPLIYGGTGNGPAFVERSANIRQAAFDIVCSKTFDNGIAPSAEQSIVVDSPIDGAMKEALRSFGAYFMSEEEATRLADLFFCTNGRYKAGVRGASAEKLAKKAGIAVPENVSVLIAERKYVSDNDPYYKEFLAPVLAYYVEDDWMNACEKCIELLLHERNGHTLAIHSTDAEVIRQFAIKKPVGRLLVNTPAAFGGIGATTNLTPAMTLGSGVAGYGITSDNVSAENLIYIRKIGFGVRPMLGVEPLYAPAPASGQKVFDIYPAKKESDGFWAIAPGSGGHAIGPSGTGKSGAVAPLQGENSKALKQDGDEKVNALQQILLEAIEIMGDSAKS